MVSVELVSFDPARPGRDFFFSAPRAVRSARTLRAVAPLLDWAEREAARGRWAVLALAYDAAPAVNPLLTVRRPSPKTPLAWAAVFDRPGRRPPPPAGSAAAGPWRPAVSRREYRRALARVKARIAAGDTYQVNFTYPLETRFRGDVRSWFHRLGRSQGAPYSALIDAGAWAWLSFSPELFFETRGRRLTLRPMKGSAPRGRWAAEDAALADALASGPKDRAENLMIVDLLRNDAGKIAEPGTVKVRKLFEVEKYPTVHQMTSAIEARRRPGVGLRGLLAALFPSGSVTGAPKRKTMEIIAGLERAPRGLYTGALGLLRPDGRWTFNVAIRTVTLDRRTGRAICPVGSGVTWSSSAEREWEETRLKGRFLEAPDFQLVESLRLENGRCPLASDHAARLRASAERWGFPFRPAAFRRALAVLARRGRRGVWKARLRLDRRGRLGTSLEPIPPEEKSWTAALARRPVDSDSPWLYYKTTNRAIYDAWRRGRPGVDEVVGWNARGELTEGARTNLVLEKRGRFYTPPVSSGLLPGVFRARLIRAGRVREKALTKRDWRSADRVWLVNAVRGWIPAARADRPGDRRQTTSPDTGSKFSFR